MCLTLSRLVQLPVCQLIALVSEILLALIRPDTPSSICVNRLLSKGSVDACLIAEQVIAPSF